MDERVKLADFIREYRLKIKDFNDFLDYYVFVDFNRLNLNIEEIILNLTNIVNEKLSNTFIATYSGVDEAIFYIEPILEEMYKEIKKLKGLYLQLSKYEKYYDKLIFYKKLIDEILDDIEKFFIELENLVLRGEGKLELRFDIKDEIKLIKNSFKDKESRNLCKSILWGIGLGWLIFSD